jgi:hypothetical protein
MKILIINILIFSLIPEIIAAQENALPSGAIQAGSLANQKLQYDAQPGVVGKTSQLGCDKPEEYQAYVAKMPTGNPGSRTWEEIWVVKGCGKKFPIRLIFKEDGMNAASWYIK